MGVAFELPGSAKWFGKHAVDARPLLKERGLQ
jgi:hypothetical protein